MAVLILAIVLGWVFLLENMVKTARVEAGILKSTASSSTSSWASFIPIIAMAGFCFRRIFLGNELVSKILHEAGLNSFATTQRPAFFVTSKPENSPSALSRNWSHALLRSVIFVFVLSVSLTAQNKHQSVPTISAPSRADVARAGGDWIYSPGVPEALRHKLEPEYQHLATLLVELQGKQQELLSDIPWDFLSAAAGTVSSQATDAVAASAGAYKPSNAALSADSPGAAENNDLGSLILEVGATEKRIKQDRAEAGYETTIGPAPKPLDDVVQGALSPDELVRAFLAVSSSDAFQRLFDQAQQAGTKLDRAIADAQAQTNGVNNRTVSVNREIAALDEKENARAGGQKGGESIDTDIPIPSGWIKCECPDRHPNAGLFIRGARYHTAALHCDRYY